MLAYTYLVAAASLGACFANLQRINTVISDGNFDPRIQSTYWTRWVMGVIAGIVLSELVFDFLLSHSEKDTSVVAQGPLVQPILALVGGYSVDFVHGILKSTINKLGNFFGISVDDQQRAGMPRLWLRRDWPLTPSWPSCSRRSENTDMDEIRKRIDGLIQRISVRPG